MGGGGSISASELASTLLASLSAEERARFPVYLDTTLRPAGSVLTVDEKSIPLAVVTAVAFVDEQPGANWMHPCRYLLFEPETGTVRTLPASRPPMFGRLSPNWHIISKPAAFESWQLLPLSDTNR